MADVFLDQLFGWGQAPELPVVPLGAEARDHDDQEYEGGSEEQPGLEELERSPLDFSAEASKVVRRIEEQVLSFVTAVAQGELSALELVSCCSLDSFRLPACALLSTWQVARQQALADAWWNDPWAPCYVAEAGRQWSTVCGR